MAVLVARLAATTAQPRFGSARRPCTPTPRKLPCRRSSPIAAARAQCCSGPRPPARHRGYGIPHKATVRAVNKDHDSGPAGASNSAPPGGPPRRLRSYLDQARPEPGRTGLRDAHGGPHRPPRRRSAGALARPCPADSAGAVIRTQVTLYPSLLVKCHPRICCSHADSELARGVSRGSGKAPPR